MCAFTFSAAVGIIVLCVSIVINAIRMAYWIIRIIFALLSKIFHLFRECRCSSHSKCCRPKKVTTDNLSPVEIGKQGEDDLCRKLRRIEKNGRILRNLHIPTSSGKTTEIDAVMLTTHGIYVFEYKNYHCNMLIPDSEDANWIRYADNSSESYEVFSPVKQNRHHVKALGRLLENMTGTYGIGNSINSYVVLGDGCKIRTERKTYIESTKIMNLSELNSLSNSVNKDIPVFTVLLLEELLERYQNVKING